MVRTFITSIAALIQLGVLGAVIAADVSPSAGAPAVDPPHSGNPAVGEVVKVALHATDNDSPPTDGTTPCTPTWGWTLDNVQYRASSMAPWTSSSASVSITHPDPSGDSPDDAILEGTFAVAGEYKITVTATLSYDCGPSDSGSIDVTVSIDCPGVDHLEFSLDGGATWQSFPSGGLYVADGLSAIVKAIPSPSTATFPSGQPTWSGCASGSGVTASLSGGPSVDMSDTFSVIATSCSGSPLTEDVIFAGSDTGTLDFSEPSPGTLHCDCTFLCWAEDADLDGQPDSGDLELWIAGTLTGGTSDALQLATSIPFTNGTLGSYSHFCTYLRTGSYSSNESFGTDSSSSFAAPSQKLSSKRNANLPQPAAVGPTTAVSSGPPGKDAAKLKKGAIDLAQKLAQKKGGAIPVFLSPSPKSGAESTTGTPIDILNDVTAGGEYWLGILGSTKIYEKGAWCQQLVTANPAKISMGVIVISDYWVRTCAASLSNDPDLRIKKAWANHGHSWGHFAQTGGLSKCLDNKPGHARLWANWYNVLGIVKHVESTDDDLNELTYHHPGSTESVDIIGDVVTISW